MKCREDFLSVLHVTEHGVAVNMTLIVHNAEGM